MKGSFSMKRKQLLALILALSLLLGGCASDDPVPDEISSDDTTTSSEEAAAEPVPPFTSSPSESDSPGFHARTTRETFTSSPSESDLPAENLSVGSGETLDRIPYGDLVKANLTASDAVREVLWIPETLAYSKVRYISENEISIADQGVNTRFSTREMGETALSDAAKAESWYNYGKCGVTVTFSDPTLRVGKFENGTLPIKSAALSYMVQFEEPRTLRGFVRIRISTVNKTEIIFEPADLREIPLLSKQKRDLTFTVNGETVVADTISAVVSYGVRNIAAEIEKQVGVGSTDYVYAEFTLDGLTVNYDTAIGYQNYALNIADFKILTDDTAAVIRGDRIFGRETDSEQAESLYSELMSGFDRFYDDEVVGVVLLDMDFDGEPELLVSKKTEGEENQNCIDVSVYRLQNGEITLLDTIAGITDSAFGSNGASTAVLGLKTLENGEKAWFAMTGEYKTDENRGGCLDTGKLFTLENGKIHEEELFSLWQSLDGGMRIQIYFGDTPAEFFDNGGKTMFRTPWGDEVEESGMFGYYNLKNTYCGSIEQSVYLLSDWLVPTRRLANNSICVNLEARFSPSPRDKANAVAFLVDSYCFGDYSADFGGYVYNFHEAPAMKPVIYLYPEEKTDVSVSVDFPNGGEFTCTYPEYGEGWKVTALPDGTLYDESGNEYYCLYWEGAGLPLFDLGEGWCVPGADTAEFLREKLLEIGLTAREANEMIIYWLPLLQKNPYNLISFHFEDYDRAAPLTVSPEPDMLIRVFMTYSPCEEWVEIEPQVLPRYTRRGFTAVEWGGCELRLSE